MSLWSSHTKNLNASYLPEMGKSELSASLIESVSAPQTVTVNEPIVYEDTSKLHVCRENSSPLNNCNGHVPSSTLEVPRSVTSFSARSYCSSTNSVLSDCILNATHVGYPLLGSPNTCGFWSPLPRCDSPSSSTESENCQLMFSPDLATSAPSMEPSCGDLLQDLVEVSARLDYLTLEIRHMRSNAQMYSTSVKRLATRVDKLLQVAVHLRRDLADVTYLEQIIHVLNGDLNHVHLHKWPFRLLRPLSHEELDLIV